MAQNRDRDRHQKLQKHKKKDLESFLMKLAGMLLCVAVCWNVLQRVAACSLCNIWNVLQRVAACSLCHIYIRVAVLLCACMWLVCIHIDLYVYVFGCFCMLYM